MKRLMQRILPLAMAVTTVAAHGQFYKNTFKGASVSTGVSGQFTTELETSPSSANYTALRTGGGSLIETASGQQQFTTDSLGLVVSVQFHPVAWAGAEVNYGMNRYSEVYDYNSTSAPGQSQHVHLFAHELTGAYVFHPKHIKFQPFMTIGGGAISFLPAFASNQWRATGLVEAGFDIPTKNPHLAFRAEGRALIYRAPNFNDAVLSSHSWRSTEEPVISAVFRF